MAHATSLYHSHTESVEVSSEIPWSPRAIFPRHRAISYSAELLKTDVPPTIDFGISIRKVFCV